MPFMLFRETLSRGSLQPLRWLATTVDSIVGCINDARENIRVQDISH
jgi:hypothetical protein